MKLSSSSSSLFGVLYSVRTLSKLLLPLLLSLVAVITLKSTLLLNSSSSSPSSSIPAFCWAFSPSLVYLGSSGTTTTTRTRRNTAASLFSSSSKIRRHSAPRSSSSSSTRRSQSNLSYEIKEYRDGLSQINRGNSTNSTSTTTTNINNNNAHAHARANATADANEDVQARVRTKPTECVFKFGGSSLADSDRIDHVAHLIQDQIALGYKPRAVVCSAMGKTTNNLLSAGEFALEGNICVDAIRTLHTNAMDMFNFAEDCHTRIEVGNLLTECEQMLTGVKMIQELSPKSLDQLVSYGERCSVRIMAARLNQIGVPAQAFDAWDVGICTDSNFGDAALVPRYETEIKKVFDSRIDSSIVAIVTGFIGHDPNHKITTLGRGGSDLTATAIGAALQLEEIQVWKDVDGILSTDPRIVPHAVPLDQVSFEEASELAYFGAQVLHPIAMKPAMKHNIPVRVKNSYNPSAAGTIIQQEKSPMNRLVTAITYKKGVTVLDICSTQMLGAYGFLARVFGEFEKHKLSVDVLASSEVSVSLTLDRKQDSAEIDNLIEDLSPCARISRKDNYSIVTLIADVEQSSRVLATAFQVFASHDIHVEMMSQGASKVNISFIVKSDCLEHAIQQLHCSYFDDNDDKIDDDK